MASSLSIDERLDFCADKSSKNLSEPNTKSSGTRPVTPVPIAAAVYHDDAYVPRELSLETARRVPNLRTWVTNTYEHNGLRADGPRIVKRLLAMVRGTA